MKILAVSGSPRHKNTDYMIKKVIESSGINGEIIFLRDLKIFNCSGCGLCRKNFKCVIEDDMKEIYNKLINADIIILGSPTYFNNVSGLMKNFMDRCIPFYFFKKLKSKKIILLSVGNFKEDLEFDKEGKCKWHNEERKSVLACIKTMKDFCEILGLNIIGRCYALHSNPKDEEDELIRLGKLIKKT
ncbi:MAG: flavodoxin family protein [Candidatus Nanoarchaeia archaeon]